MSLSPMSHVELINAHIALWILGVKGHTPILGGSAPIDTGGFYIKQYANWQIVCVRTW